MHDSAAGVSPDSGRETVRGVQVRAHRVPGVPVVALRLWLWGGSRIEGIPGLAWVTGRMLSEGTRSSSWRQIAEACEALGMAFGSFGSLEVHGLGVDCLSRDWRRALSWMAELALGSTFPAERCDWLRRQGAAELESLGDQPEAVTAWAFAEQLYAPHPACRPLPGNGEDLARIDSTACASFHRQALDRGGILAVAGDVQEAQVLRLAGDLFGPVQHGRAEDGQGRAKLPSIEGTGAARRSVVTPARDQAYLYAGHLTVPRHHPDLAALEVGSVILGSGAGLSGRIPERVREREGLAYSASATAVAGAGLDPGRLCAAVGTSPDTLTRAETCIREELVRLLDAGTSLEEFERARTYLLRRLSFQRETPRQWTGLLAQEALYGLPLTDPAWSRERYEELDRDSVLAALRRHLDPDRVVVTVGVPQGRARVGGAPPSSRIRWHPPRDRRAAASASAHP